MIPSPGTAARSDAVLAAADRLAAAAESGEPCAPVRDLIGSTDGETAYEIQRMWVGRRLAAGGTSIGRKIGLTSEAVQTQLGVDQPDFGVLLDDMGYADGARVGRDAVLQPRVEAEVAFVLAEDLADGDLGVEQVRDAIEYAVAAIEVCGSRIRDWDISFADTVADNASAGAFVLGGRRVGIDELEPREVVMRMSVNGHEVSRGTGTACLGDPLRAVAWLARRTRALGQPLRAGELVLSGALGPMHPVRPGDRVRAELTPLGTVAFELGQEAR